MKDDDAPHLHDAPLGTSRRTQTQNGRLRLLLVEDDRDTLYVVSKLLESHGFEVMCAESVSDALHLSGVQPFDILIADIGLPDGTGWDIMKVLRTHRAVVGIAMTGYGMPEDHKRSREAGFAAHLTKPISLDMLLDTISDAVTAVRAEE